MKKLIFALSFISCLFASVANAATLEERIAKVEAKYEQRIEKIEKSRYVDERKALLKEHARQNADLKIKQMKDLDNLKQELKKQKQKKVLLRK